MAVLLNVLFVLVIATIGFALVVVVALPVIHLVHRGQSGYWRRIWGSVACLSIAYVVSLVAWHQWATWPSAVFEMAFRFPPPPDVRIETSSHFVLGDQGSQTLRFWASRATIDRIARERFGVGLEEQSLDEVGGYHLTRTFSEHFATEKIVLRYDPEQRSAYYSWVGVD